jgi:hypothetical protein
VPQPPQNQSGLQPLREACRAPPVPAQARGDPNPGCPGPSAGRGETQIPGAPGPSHLGTGDYRRPNWPLIGQSQPCRQDRPAERGGGFNPRTMPTMKNAGLQPLRAALRNSQRHSQRPPQPQGARPAAPKATPTSRASATFSPTYGSRTAGRGWIVTFYSILGKNLLHS